MYCLWFYWPGAGVRDLHRVVCIVYLSYVVCRGKGCVGDGLGVKKLTRGRAMPPPPPAAATPIYDIRGRGRGCGVGDWVVFQVLESKNEGFGAQRLSLSMVVAEGLEVWERH